MSVAVTNTGERSGEEIVQLYINTPVCDVTRPIRSLVGFKRIPLDPDQTETVEFTITPEMMKTLDAGLNETVDNGVFAVFVGASSKDKDLLRVTFEVE